MWIILEQVSEGENQSRRMRLLDCVLHVMLERSEQETRLLWCTGVEFEEEEEKVYVWDGMSECRLDMSEVLWGDRG